MAVLQPTENTSAHIYHAPTAPKFPVTRPRSRAQIVCGETFVIGEVCDVECGGIAWEVLDREALAWCWSVGRLVMAEAD
jgi:hypothetical protein